MSPLKSMERRDKRRRQSGRYPHISISIFHCASGPVLLLGAYLTAPDIFNLRLCNASCRSASEIWKAQRILSHVFSRDEWLLGSRACFLQTAWS
jgi:hypothetical protein